MVACGRQHSAAAATQMLNRPVEVNVQSSEISFSFCHAMSRSLPQVVTESRMAANKGSDGRYAGCYAIAWRKTGYIAR